MLNFSIEWIQDKTFLPIIDKPGSFESEQAAYCVIRDKFGFLSELSYLFPDQIRGMLMI